MATLGCACSASASCKAFSEWARIRRARVLAPRKVSQASKGLALPRIAISRDEGRTWTADWVLRGDGPDWDLGYPSTVELADGSLLTVCYQKAAAEEPCALRWSRWRLPAAEPQIASEP